MKFCAACGAKNSDGVPFCAACGADLSDGQTISERAIWYGIFPRSIPLAIMLSILTCGIYYIFWFVVLTNESNKLANVNMSSGVPAYLFSVLTCGIYGYYWLYKLGEKRDIISNHSGGSSGVLFLVLGFFGLSIVACSLAQDAINKAASHD